MPLTCAGLQFPKTEVVTPRARRLLRQGAYEAKEARALHRLIRAGDRVLELGGGLGFLSARARRLGAAKVLVVEANPRLVDYIGAQHAANAITEVTVLHGLACAKDGPGAQFHIRRNFLASSGADLPNAGEVLDSPMVPALGIAGLMLRAQPDVLVCDIEGAEAEVLPQADLRGLRAAIVELHPQWIGGAGVAAVFDAFARAGMTYAAKGSEGKVVVFERIAKAA